VGWPSVVSPFGVSALDDDVTHSYQPGNVFQFFRQRSLLRLLATASVADCGEFLHRNNFDSNLCYRRRAERANSMPGVDPDSDKVANWQQQLLCASRSLSATEPRLAARALTIRPLALRPHL
jgi:hypothetical protein